MRHGSPRAGCVRCPGRREVTEGPPAAPTLRRSRRVLLMLFVFVVWALFITVRLSRVMVFDRGALLAVMNRESWREGEIAPLRGRILDRDGTPLAWSTRHFLLAYRVPEEKDRIESDLARVAEAVPELALPDVYLLMPLAGEEATLTDDLMPTQTASLSTLAEEMKALRVTTRVVRHRHPDPRVRARVGDVEMIDGIPCGVSGEEKKHEHLLRGVPGQFRVMVDRKGQWIRETWEEMRELRAGYDVYVSLRVGQPASVGGRTQ